MRDGQAFCVELMVGDYMKCKIYSYSDVGGRSNNEDEVATTFNENDLLAIAADGLGGYSAGEIASKYVVSRFTEWGSDEQCTVESLLSVVESTNEQIRALQNQYGKMMSTLAVLWIQIKERIATAINIGDTRIYQFRDGEIIFQSIDHSVAQIAVLAGDICKEDIRNYHGRNRLIRALGAEDSVKTECVSLTIEIGDRFLLCTDGFWEIVTEDIMKTTLIDSHDPEEWLSKMKDVIIVSTINNKDNNSAIAIYIDK